MALEPRDPIKLDAPMLLAIVAIIVAGTIPWIIGAAVILRWAWFTLTAF